MFSNITSYGESNQGINRLAYSKEEQEALKYLKEIALVNNLSVEKDAIGNLIIRREGIDDTLPIVAMGSHIDSVYNGGKYDGVIGVIAGLEIMLSLNDASVQTKRSIELIVFACEESARFGTATIGSKAMIGDLKKSELLRLIDKNGISFKDALNNLNLDLNQLSTVKRKATDFFCFIELHIEQGPILEQRNIDIGIVTGIAAPTRFKILIFGEASHSGSTPMNYRKDALTGASEVALSLEEIAIEETHYNTVATIGVSNVLPGAMNVIPGQVELLVDIRSINRQSKFRVVDKFTKSVNEICKQRNLTFDIQLLSDEVPTLMDENIIGITQEVCEKLNYSYKKLPSGAGHDAMNMASLCKTGMIFVSSKDGLSHNPNEFTKLNDIEKGVKVLENIVIKLADN